MSGILTPSPLPGRQSDAWFLGVCHKGEGQETQAWPLLCNPESTQKTPLGSDAVGKRRLGQSMGGNKDQPLLPVPCPRCSSTGMLGKGIGSRCGLPGWTSGGLLFPSSPARSSHRLGSFPCVLGLERKWGGLQQGAPGERCPSRVQKIHPGASRERKEGDRLPS